MTERPTKGTNEVMMADIVGLDQTIIKLLIIMEYETPHRNK